MTLRGSKLATLVALLLAGCSDAQPVGSPGPGTAPLPPAPARLVAQIDRAAEQLSGRMGYHLVESPGVPGGSFVLRVEGPQHELEIAMATPDLALVEGREVQLDFERIRPEHQGSVYDLAGTRVRHAIESGRVRVQCEARVCQGQLELALEDGRRVEGAFEGGLGLACWSYAARHGSTDSPLAPGVPSVAMDLEMRTAFCQPYRSGGAG